MARLTRLTALLLLAFGTACQPFHLPGGGFDDGPQIDEHGISVPVPPPSLTAAPRQTVDVEGDVNDPDFEPGTKVSLVVYSAADTDQDVEYRVDAAADGTFAIKDRVLLDLTDNCIEVWYERPGSFGSQSVSSFYRAAIGDDDQSIVTTQFFNGCPNL